MKDIADSLGGMGEIAFRTNDSRGAKYLSL
jgi:hypothetical protein